MVEKLHIYTNEITFVIDKNTPLKHKTEKKSNNTKSENTRLWCHKTLEYDFSNHILKKTANQKLYNIYHVFWLGIFGVRVRNANSKVLGPSPLKESSLWIHKWHQSCLAQYKVNIHLLYYTNIFHLILYHRIVFNVLYFLPDFSNRCTIMIYL